MSFTLKLKTFVRRLALRSLHLSRPSSSPFLSGDSFRALAQFIYDESADFNPTDVNESDIVFVRTGWLKDFFNNVDPHIKNRYVLISHNEDTSITEEYIALFAKSGKIIHWFAQNLSFSHKDFSPIPIGLQNFYYKHGNTLAAINSIKKENNNKTLTAFCGFGIEGNGNASERKSILDTSKNLPWVETAETTGLEYLRVLSKSKFVLSPAGSGEDCHRTWEALYLGSIPVVKQTPLTEYFAAIGIPLYILGSWDDLNKITEQELETFYEKHSSALKSPALYMPYWIKLISSKIDEMLS